MKSELTWMQLPANPNQHLGVVDGEILYSIVAYPGNLATWTHEANPHSSEEQYKTRSFLELKFAKAAVEDYHGLIKI